MAKGVVEHYSEAPDVFLAGWRHGYLCGMAIGVVAGLLYGLLAYMQGHSVAVHLRIAGTLLFCIALCAASDWYKARTR